MKKLLILILQALISVSVNAQNYMIVEQNDHTTTKYNVDNIFRVFFETDNSLELPEGLEAVDLGLPSGTMWANMNIGAQTPEGYGLYFAWGETIGYGTDTNDGHSFEASNYTFDINNVKTLSIENDAATAYWGNDWRMPTYEDGVELLEYCETEWMTQNNVAGMKCTSKINGKSIFFPAAGDRFYNNLNGMGDYAVYWLASICPTKSRLASDLRFLSTIAHVNDNHPYVGQNIRPVKSKEKEHNDEFQCPDNNHPHMIDLGLPTGTKWACSNVGASAPEEFGGYFAWGETEESDYYYWNNYKYSSGSFPKVTKYCTNASYGPIDNLTQLEKDDDAAQLLWGDNWRMPTHEEQLELLDNCTAEWVKQNDVYGLKLTGSNGNSIFLPASGRKWQGNTLESDWGFYWSSTLYPNSSYAAKDIQFSSNRIDREVVAHRCGGHNIRPVLKGSNEGTTNPDDSETKKFTINGVSFNMMKVEGGTFMMGDNSSDSYSAEQPVHEVRLSSYYIGETEVTQELWEAVMDGNPSKDKGAKMPVDMVSWDDCQTFIVKLNQLAGQQFRLPTEAEWEFAARGGTKSHGYKYSGSNTYDDVAWCQENRWDLGEQKPYDVAEKQPNELGIYDMSGNVWEWCYDWYGNYNSSSTIINNPQGPDNGSVHVHRGGSFGNTFRHCRVSHRIYYNAPVANWGVGLRLAL